MTEPRTVTVSTRDHGDVTTVCPPWCNEGMHQPGGYRADITHVSNDTELTVRAGDAKTVLLRVVLEQVPFSSRPAEREPFLSVEVDDDWHHLSPAGLHQLADSLADVAEQLRALAARYAPLVGDDRPKPGPTAALATMARRLAEQAAAGHAPWDNVIPEGGNRQTTSQQLLGNVTVRLTAAILTTPAVPGDEDR